MGEEEKLNIPDSLWTCYGRHLGPDGIGLWLYMAYHLERGLGTDAEKHLGIDQARRDALEERLVEAGLLEFAPLKDEEEENLSPEARLIRAIFPDAKRVRLYGPLARADFAREYHDAEGPLGCRDCPLCEWCEEYEAAQRERGG